MAVWGSAGLLPANTPENPAHQQYIRSNQTMTTELTTYTADDGWDEAAAETSGRAIQGTLLKFNDWKTAAAFVRWEDKRPVEYIWREKGKPLPDREALSMWDDRSEWEIGLSG